MLQPDIEVPGLGTVGTVGYHCAVARQTGTAGDICVRRELRCCFHAIPAFCCPQRRKSEYQS